MTHARSFGKGTATVRFRCYRRATPRVLALIVVAFRTMGRVSRHRPDDTPERRSEAAMAQALRACLVGYCVTAFFLSQAYAAYLYSLLGLVTAVSVLSRVRRDGPTAMPGWRTPTGIHG